MIRSKFAALRSEKEVREGRRLSIRTIAAEAGVSPGTIQRLSHGDVDRVYLRTLSLLCRYFCLQQVSELIEYVPDEVS